MGRIFQTLFYEWAKGLVASVYGGIFRGDVIGSANVPQHGAFILAANHLSFIDPPFIGCALPRPIYYFARDTLFQHPIASWVMHSLHAIPVKRDAHSDVAAMKQLLKILNSGEGLLIFVEGTRSENGEMQSAKSGVGLLACKTQVPILPMKIWNSHEVLPRSNRSLNIYAHPTVQFGPLLYPKDYDLGATNKNRYAHAAQIVGGAIQNLELPFLEEI